jgi:putative DNA base modification enzyme with NMAD domain
MRERQALLLRVGIDRGTGGSLSPIFADGSFEYLPIPEAEPTRCPHGFASLPARRGGNLAAFVPSRIAQRPAHIDPDFAAFTYGDAALHKRRQLLRLEPGDLIVF